MTLWRDRKRSRRSLASGLALVVVCIIIGILHWKWVDSLG
jgi:hypothetical protein